MRLSATLAMLAVLGLASAGPMNKMQQMFKDGFTGARKLVNRVHSQYDACEDELLSRVEQKLGKKAAALVEIKLDEAKAEAKKYAMERIVGCKRQFSLGKDLADAREALGELEGKAEKYAEATGLPLDKAFAWASSRLNSAALESLAFLDDKTIKEEGDVTCFPASA